MTGPISAYFVGVKGGLVMSLIAFSIVFIVIIGLMLIMMSIKYMAAAVDGKGGGNGEKTADAPKTSVAPAASSAPVKAVAASEDEGELLAVISAAIAAMCGSAARVVAFSPVTKAPVATSWKFASRISNREGFQD